MKEKSIIFRGDGVLAILEGRKTQTRRVITEKWQLCRSPEDEPEWFIENCPYGKAGDRLWVRETFGINLVGFEHGQLPKSIPIDQATNIPAEIIYRADGEIREQFEPEIGATWSWRPSIFMPRWASRITLEITDVRVERLQEISLIDCIDEGIKDEFCLITNAPITKEIMTDIARKRFADLWNSLNVKRGYGWNVNPWVWVIEYRKLDTKEQD